MLCETCKISPAIQHTGTLARSRNTNFFMRTCFKRRNIAFSIILISINKPNYITD
jgi:hypothetical protein